MKVEFTMYPRLWVLLAVPLMVLCFECTEEIENDTRIIQKENYDHGNMTLENVIESFVQNSTIVCSHLDQLTDNIFQFKPKKYQQFLRIQDSNISTLHPSAFSKFTTITRLSLSGNHVKFVLPGAFQNLKKLQELHLANNELTAVSKGAFDSLRELHILNLSNNHIRSIEDFSFMELCSLQKVFLSRNQLSEIGVNTFQGVRELGLLDLYQNVIEHFSIDDNTTIKVLNLSSNCLLSVDFHNLSKCEIADFSQNEIFFVEALNQTNITYLDISNNNLKYINPSGIIKILNIRQNKLDDINLNFNGLTDLLKVSLSSNQITSLEKHVFHNLTSLQFLDLSFNDLNLIERILFHDLEKLRFLDLSHNQIERFQFGTFNNLKNIIFLDISYNQLLQLDIYALILMSDLKYLYFENNQISSLDTTSLIPLRNLRTISLADNVWKCHDIAFISYELERYGVEMLRGNRFDVDNLYGISCSSQIEEMENVSNTSLGDSDFVKFFNHNYSQTKFFQYFDNLFDNQTRKDSTMRDALRLLQQSLFGFSLFIIILLVLIAVSLCVIFCRVFHSYKN